MSSQRAASNGSRYAVRTCSRSLRPAAFWRSLRVQGRSAAAKITRTCGVTCGAGPITARNVTITAPDRSSKVGRSRSQLQLPAPRSLLPLRQRSRRMRMRSTRSSSRRSTSSRSSSPRPGSSWRSTARRHGRQDPRTGSPPGRGGHCPFVLSVASRHAVHNVAFDLRERAGDLIHKRPGERRPQRFDR
jgi:hypothetical protein